MSNTEPPSSPEGNAVAVQSTEKASPGDAGNLAEVAAQSNTAAQSDAAAGSEDSGQGAAPDRGQGKRQTGRKRSRLVLYWTMMCAFVVWAWTTLYIQSYGNVWGGKDDSIRRGILEQRQMLDELATMEKNGATPESIYDQRIKLSIQRSQAKDFDGARNVLLAEEKILADLPNSAENFGRRVRIHGLIGHAYMDQNKMGEARNSFNTALALAGDMKSRFGTEEASLLELSMTNELGVLTYLEANSTLDGRLRAKTFAKCEAIFVGVIASLDKMNADPAGLSDQTRKHIARLKEHVAANLALVREDIAHEDEYQKT